MSVVATIGDAPRGNYETVGDLVQTPELGELAAALALFQADATGVPKGQKATDKRKNKATGQYYETTREYASLADAWSAARAPLTKHGLSVMQWPTSPKVGWIKVTTRLLHKSGQWMQSSLSIAIDETAYMNPTQKYGSAITYACRYAFLAVLGLPPAADDDGQAAGGGPGAKTSPAAGPKERKKKPPKKNKGTQNLENALKKVTNWEQYKEPRKAYEQLSPPQKDLIKGAFMQLHKKLTDSTCPECKGAMDLGAELCSRCAPKPADVPPLAEEVAAANDEQTTDEGITDNEEDSRSDG